MGLGLVKDRSFARMFGTGAPRAIPAPTFVLFAARDALTIFSSFNVPPLLAPYMPQNTLMRPESWAQFLAPASCQFVSTPLHLLGLDLYNRGENLGVKARWQKIKANYLPSVAARMCRILPASVGTRSILRFRCVIRMADVRACVCAGSGSGALPMRL